MTSAANIGTDVEKAVPFFWVRDLEQSLAFYVDGLGFTKTKEWVDDGVVRWCWLELGGSSIMLQQFWREGPHRNLPDGPVGVGVIINFICKDAVAIYHDLRSRGVGAKRPFVGNGMWVAQVTDPDGYQLCFESPTDAEDESPLDE